MNVQNQDMKLGKENKKNLMKEVLLLIKSLIKIFHFKIKKQVK